MAYPFHTSYCQHQARFLKTDLQLAQVYKKAINEWCQSIKSHVRPSTPSPPARNHSKTSRVKITRDTGKRTPRESQGNLAILTLHAAKQILRRIRQGELVDRDGSQLVTVEELDQDIAGAETEGEPVNADVNGGAVDDGGSERGIAEGSEAVAEDRGRVGLRTLRVAAGDDRCLRLRCERWWSSLYRRRRQGCDQRGQGQNDSEVSVLHVELMRSDGKILFSITNFSG